MVSRGWGTVINSEICFKFARERLKANFTFYVLGFFIYSMAQQALGVVPQFLAQMILAAEPSTEDVGFIILGVGGFVALSFLLSLPLMPLKVGYTKGIRKEVVGEGSGELTDLFSEFRNSIPVVFNLVVAGAVVMLGFLCLVVPGLLLMPLPYLTAYLLAGGQTSGLDAVTSAWSLLWKNPVLILWTFVFGIISLLGLLACCVGAYVSFPFALAAYCKMIQQAIDAGLELREPPPLPV